MPRKSSRASSSSDTIAAVSSPPGAGLRAVVRLSGPDAAALAAGEPGAVLFRAPRSYTGEDVAELHLPGSPPLVEACLRRLAERGARPARPGEFTLRAFLNGRMDLSRAEAVERLIAAEDDAERRAALEALAGGFSDRLRRIEALVLDLTADVEASIDFVDQDIEILPLSEAADRAAALAKDLADLLRETAAARVADERPVAALYGPANAGKSTLFNALTGGRAIISDREGTTRDVLEGELEVGGRRVRLLDAAGQRGGEGIDAEAERRARAAAEAADLVLFVVDAADWERARKWVLRGRPAILVVNKIDRASAEGAAGGLGMSEAVAVSARTGAGLEELRERIARRLAGDEAPVSGARYRVSVRQHGLLREAREALGRAASSGPALGVECLALDLRAALEALGGVTGRCVGEDLLDRIFSRFCLGK